MMRCLTLPLLLLAMLVPPAVAAPVVAQADHIEVTLLSEREHYPPGSEVWLGLNLDHDPKWHTYWVNPGDSGLVTRLRWSLPQGIEAGEPTWPHPERFEIAEIVNYGYGDEILIPIPLQLAPDLAVGDHPIGLRASWLICEVECIPGQAELQFTLAVREGQAGPLDADWQAAFTEARARVPQAVSWPARFDIQGQQVVLEIEAGTAWQQRQDTTLYPQVAQFISHALPRASVSEGERWQSVHALNDFYDSAPERVELVLVGGKGAQPRAVSVVAEPAELRPAADIIAAAGQGPTAPVAESVGFFTALAFALVGGLVLNLMPCVFPVLSLKALTLKQDPHLRRHGLLYTAGVVASFLALAVLLLALRSAGEALGWGFQLQSPGLIAALAVLFFAMGLSLSGVISFGERLMGLGQDLAAGESDRAAFMTGVLAAVVASPCTAPLMGTAMGYAVTQPAAISLAVFAALGLGLALPFLALSMIPALVRFMPRPGAWMESFKQFLAFPLYATVVWLLWVYGIQMGIDAMALLAMALVGVGLALWALERASRNGGWLLRGVAAVSLLASAAAVIWAPSAPLAASPGGAAADAVHEPFDEDRLQQLVAEGRPVFVNMTAAWCITCLANERVALATDTVRAAMDSIDMVYMKGDWTRRDDHITRYLERYGRTGVPLYVVYRPGQPPQVLPQLLTPELVVAAIGAD